MDKHGRKRQSQQQSASSHARNRGPILDVRAFLAVIVILIAGLAAAHFSDPATGIMAAAAPAGAVAALLRE